MLEKASCPICTAHYVRGEVAALICGHTFHLSCIERWLATSKTCPSCRKSIRDKQIVKQLFFTFEDNDDGTPRKSQAYDAHEKLENTLLELQQAKQDLYEQKKTVDIKEAELIHCNGERERLKKKLATNDTFLQNMKEKVRWMEMEKEETDQLKKRCEKLEDALKACEFFQKIIRANGDEEMDEVLHKYCVKGNIDTDGYMKLFKGQAEKYKQRSVANAEEVRSLKKENAKLVSKERELQTLVKALTDELNETRASCNKNTPYNLKLKPMLDKSPVKRISMGFDETVILNSDVFDSAVRKPPSKKPFVGKPLASSAEDIRDLDHFFELEAAGAIHIEDPRESPDIVQLTDGSFMNKRSYQARNAPTPQPFLSMTKKAHLRMEAENEQRAMKREGNRDETVKQPAKLVARKTNRKLDKEPKTKNARLSTFFKANSGKIDIIEIE